MFKVSKNPIKDDRLKIDISDLNPEDNTIYFTYTNYRDKPTEEIFKAKQYYIERINTTPLEKVSSLMQTIIALTYILGERVVEV